MVIHPGTHKHTHMVLQPGTHTHTHIVLHTGTHTNTHILLNLGTHTNRHTHTHTILERRSPLFQFIFVAFKMAACLIRGMRPEECPKGKMGRKVKRTKKRGKSNKKNLVFFYSTDAVC